MVWEFPPWIVAFRGKCEQMADFACSCGDLRSDLYIKVLIKKGTCMMTAKLRLANYTPFYDQTTAFLLSKIQTAASKT